MRILLLGGTGAMGTPLARQLIEKGYDVYITSRKQYQDSPHLKYIVGNAMDDLFVKSLLQQKYDVIVDFMIYTEAQLEFRIGPFLNACSQYIFLSSCRVYAPSDSLLTEQSPRLLDVCQDEDFFKTNEYALAKAREENIILSQKLKNWTIIRPSLTYNVGRLQLGCYELKNWFSRIQNKKSIVFQHDLENVQVSMTHGDDVARVMSLVVGNDNALGEFVQIASPETKSWKDILSIYLKVLQEANLCFDVFWQNDSLTVSQLLGREWRRKYATMINRRFDSSKVERICGKKIEYIPMDVGLRDCLNKTILDNKTYDVDYKLEAYLDRVSKEKRIAANNLKNWCKYSICRYSPYFKIKYKDYSEA